MLAQFTLKHVLAACIVGCGAIAGVSADDDRWDNPDGEGNTRIAVKDKVINWGSTPPWRALGELIQHCSSVGCMADDVLTVSTRVVEFGDRFDTEIELSARASFSENDDFGSRENLVEVARQVAVQLYEVEKVEYDGERGCEASPNVGCIPGRDDPPPTEDQYKTFNEIHIRVDEGTGPDLFISIGVKDRGSDSALCETITGAGGAIAGVLPAIGGGASTIFSLASLICGEL